MRMARQVLVIALVAACLLTSAGCRKPQPDAGDRAGGGQETAVPGDRYEPTQEEREWIEANIGEPSIRMKKFGDHYILLVAAGEKPSGGYAVVIDQITTVENEWVIDVRFTEPEPGSMVTMALTYPYEIVKIKDLGLGVRVREVTAGDPKELEVTGE